MLSVTVHLGDREALHADLTPSDNGAFITLEDTRGSVEIHLPGRGLRAAASARVLMAQLGQIADRLQMDPTGLLSEAREIG